MMWSNWLTSDGLSIPPKEERLIAGRSTTLVLKSSEGKSTLPLWICGLLAFLLTNLLVEEHLLRPIRDKRLPRGLKK